MTSSTSSHQVHRLGRGSRHLRNEPVDLAARILSEAAHDLRSPLTAVRESIRLVRDAHVGTVNEDQRSCLTDAITQCDCIDQMVTEMLQLDRFRSGRPRVHRRWVPVAEIRESIDQTLRPWALPRNIAIEWDDLCDPELQVYADATSLRRLVVNLVANAIRATRDGEVILIALRNRVSEGTVHWSIVDRGSGISPHVMERIDSRQAASAGGEGLGLMICRQLAAQQFSSLTIRSRQGSGTEVSFETPGHSARAIVSRWLRWRRAMRGSESSSGPPSVRNTVVEPGTRVVRPPTQTRLKPPVMTVELTSDIRARSSTISAGTVTLDAELSRQAVDQFDKSFQQQMRLFDLAYRISARRWIWMLDADASSCQGLIEAISTAIADQLEGLQAVWSEPFSLPDHEAKTAAILSDFMTRQALNAAVVENVQELDQVRLGTEPIRASLVAAERLDAELRRLSTDR